MKLVTIDLYPATQFVSNDVNIEKLFKFLTEKYPHFSFAMDKPYGNETVVIFSDALGDIASGTTQCVYDEYRVCVKEIESV